MLTEIEITDDVKAQLRTKAKEIPSAGVDESCCLEEWNACCCTCKHRLADYHHCTTTGKCGDGTAFKEGDDKNACVCSLIRGYICAAHLHEDGLNGRVHSGWSEHGMCEQHWPREEKKCDVATD